MSGEAGSLDRTTNVQRSLDYAHSEIHNGDHYHIEDVSDISINNVFDVQWTTPNTAKWAHFNFRLNCESETEWMIYEGASIVTPGTLITPINNNRNSSNVSGAVIRSILNGDTDDANDDTPVAAATEIAHGIVGAGKEGGVIERDDELMLKQNTIYCMRAIATAAGYVNFLMKWYEHTNVNS